MSKRKTGTYEWADKTINCIKGCEHDCRYCYARHRVVDRFKEMPRDQWSKPTVDLKRVTSKHGKYRGIVMFPSQHDITPDFWEPCLTVIRSLIDAGNNVLVVTKPHREVIQRIVDRQDWRFRLTFRFTIGMLSENLREYWEPGAPSIEERIASLALAHGAGFKTSVSAEPLLEPWDAASLFKRCVPFLSKVEPGTPSGEIWFGMLNNIAQRVRVETDLDREMVKGLKERQSDEMVMLTVATLRHIADHLGKTEHLRWKESYQAVIDRVEGS